MIIKNTFSAVMNVDEAEDKLELLEIEAIMLGFKVDSLTSRRIVFCKNNEYVFGIHVMNAHIRIKDKWIKHHDLLFGIEYARSILVKDEGV